MAFGRKRSNRDFFKSSIEERRRTEDERPWFLEDGADDLEIEAGRSAHDEELRAATEDGTTDR